MGEVIAVVANKGGVGKSSIVSNLSGVLSNQGNKVLIIDCDNQGNSALSFGQNPDQYRYTLYDVLVDGLEPNYCISPVYNNVNLLPSNDDFSYFEFDVLRNLEKFPKPFQLMKEHLSHLKKDYDYILLDTPPNMGLTHGNVLTFADRLIIPFQPETYSMRSLTKTIKSFLDFKEEHNTNLEILGIVATMVRSNTILHSQIITECRKYVLQNDLKMFDTVIPQSIRFAESVAQEGLPAVLTSKNNKLVHSYVELGEEIIEELQKNKMEV